MAPENSLQVIVHDEKAHIVCRAAADGRAYAGIVCKVRKKITIAASVRIGRMGNDWLCVSGSLRRIAKPEPAHADHPLDFTLTFFYAPTHQVSPIKAIRHQCEHGRPDKRGP